MTSKSNEFEKELLTMFERIFKGMGLDSVMSKVSSILYLNPDEVCMDNLVKKTGYSLSAVSTKLRQLENLGMVERRKRPGSKKLYYFMPKSLKRNNLAKFKAFLEHIKYIESAFPPILEKYEKDMKQSKDKRYKETYKIIENYIKELSDMETLFINFMKELEKM